MTPKRTFLTAVAATLLVAGLPPRARAQEGEDAALPILDAVQTDLDDFLWLKRPILVFADTPADPRFSQQIQLLLNRPDPLIERDVVVITDSDRDSGSEIRRRLRPRGFALVLMGKDGMVKLRKPAPWDVREITRSIDKMPMRQREIRERRSGAG